MVNRWLVARAYRTRRMVKVPRLTVRAKLVRRHWAQKHINRPLGQWRHVIFCDKFRCMLFRIVNRIRVRRLVGEAMNEDCTHGNVAHGGGSVHVWGSISHIGKNLLVRSGSDVTGAVYRRVLEDHLVPHGRAWYRNNWLLADDNARPHRDCVVDAYFHEQDIIRMDWASYRPDMNSIEHIWDEIGRGMEELDPQSVNLRQLGVVVQILRQQMPLERVQTLVRSMPRRVRALVDHRGSSTRYWTVSPRYRRVLFMFSSACGRIDVSILKLSQEFEYESLTKKRVAVFS